MSISLALHTIGLVFWLGGLIILSRILAVTVKSGGHDSVVTPFLSRAYFAYVVPGLLIALVTGVFQILQRGVAFYMSQGWFHTKLTLVAILIVATVIFGAQVIGAKRGNLPKFGKLMAVHGISSFCLIVIVLLTFVGKS